MTHRNSWILGMCVGALMFLPISAETVLGQDLETRVKNLEEKVAALSAKNKAQDVTDKDIEVRLSGLKTDLDTTETELGGRIDTSSATSLREMTQRMPIGTILPYAGEDTKALLASGWMLCDGHELDISKYGELYAVIKTAYGAPNPEQFRLPDLQGMFLRGADAGETGVGGGNDPDGVRKVGSKQGDALREHNHTLTELEHNHALTDRGHAHEFEFFNEDGSGNLGGSFPRNPKRGSTFAATSNITIAPSKTNVSIAPFGGNETRPLNVAVNFIIRYK